MQYIGLLDYVLLPLVLALIYGIAYYIRNKNYAYNHPWRKYFISGLTVKLFGAVFNGMLHYYYYGGGDTFNFFYHSGVINSAFGDSPVKWLNLVLHLPNYYDLDYYKYTSQMFWYRDPSSYTVGALGAVFGLFTFNTYLPTAALFAFFRLVGYGPCLEHLLPFIQNLQSKSQLQHYLSRQWHYGALPYIRIRFACLG